MDKYTKEELKEALNVVTSSIKNCEKMHPKFEEGTSQHTLLKNRIKALYISKSLIEEENIKEKYTKEEMEKAMAPVSSIISKCEKAKIKAVEGTGNHTRLTKIIKAMYISKYLITKEISERD
ncbi:hypothetical protein [Terrisporobacter mayombei]|uniref:Uncharacterized protein n=1 Tax=Terrisporobacter mayombei TaxID=1541 RepID=A0ABY9Q0Z1_9FIRM|nr:hypothetical protein [Terrisporobacter mayombei]MCC3866641.1 hypothetical protein [Terrisporobacter mayombei]WMT80876.1 hypothetical protein TEMA_11980 [Terrisporobacter mayombei]